jgi:hypothetical protein
VRFTITSTAKVNQKKNIDRDPVAFWLAEQLVVIFGPGASLYAQVAIKMLMRKDHRVGPPVQSHAEVRSP